MICREMGSAMRILMSEMAMMIIVTVMMTIVMTIMMMRAISTINDL